MAISEKEKDAIFHPEPDEVPFGPLEEAQTPDAGLGYHSVVDGGVVRLFDDSGVEIEVEREPSNYDPVQTESRGAWDSPAYRQWESQWQNARAQTEERDEEPPEPSYLDEIRETKIQCDCCSKTESLETANCLGGMEKDGTVFAEFGCNCGNVLGINAHDLPPRYVQRAGENEDAILDIVRDILRKRALGLE